MANKFDFKKFQNGAIAKTAIGQTAKFITMSRDRMIVKFRDLLGTETQETYQTDGRKYKNTFNPFDLVTMA